jgi:hypothetical protein
MTMILRADNAPCGPSPGEAGNVPCLFFVRNTFFEICSLAGARTGTGSWMFHKKYQRITICLPHKSARYFHQWNFRCAGADASKTQRARQGIVHDGEHPAGA